MLTQVQSDKSTPVRPETSDAQLIDLLRKQGPASVAQIGKTMGVTATAVRQRLVRLLAQGDIERSTQREGRGRPLHRYGLTEQGRRSSGANFTDLAIALWEEMRQIKDAEIRRGLLERLSRKLADRYAPAVHGAEVGERLESVAAIFRQRQIPFEVQSRSGELPTLHANACPYPVLAEQDRSICAMERMLFSNLVGEKLRLSECRLDGDRCCTFEIAGEAKASESAAGRMPADCVS